jgi:hypothetical protein
LESLAKDIHGFDPRSKNHEPRTNDEKTLLSVFYPCFIRG